MILTSRADHVTETVYALLKSLKVKVTKSDLKEVLREHPDYPSLFAIKEILEFYKVDNTTIKIPVENIYELSTPLLIHVNENGKQNFSVVKAIENGQVTRLNSDYKWITESMSQFCGIWSGVVMLAEPTKNAGDKDYSKKRKIELLNSFRIPAIITISLIILSGAITNNIDITIYNWWAIFTAKILGTIICVILLSQMIDKNNPLIAKLCKLGNEMDCGNILNSPASKIWGWLSWSELGFFYFAGGLFSILIASHQSFQMLGIFAILNLFTLLFSAYSVYYQFVVAKKRCSICLSILVIFWIEFAFLLPYWGNINLQLRVLYPLMLGFFIPILFWITIKPLASGGTSAKYLKKELDFFKKNLQVFQILLSKQQKMPSLNGLSPIVLGNPSAQNTITVVSNPVCLPCRETHLDIEMLLESEIDVKIQMIFAVGNDKSSLKFQVAKYFIYAFLNASYMPAILHDWFIQDDQNYKAWQNDESKNFDLDFESERILGLHEAWCKEARINYTPTIFVNGFKNPNIYSLADLQYIMKRIDPKTIVV